MFPFKKKKNKKDETVIIEITRNSGIPGMKGKPVIISHPIVMREDSSVDIYKNDLIDAGCKIIWKYID